MERAVALEVETLEAVDVIHERDHRFVKKPKPQIGCAVCGAGKHRMVHHGHTVSLNDNGAAANSFGYQAIKKSWGERLVELLDASGLPRGLGRVEARGQMCFPDRQRRDQGNYRFLIEKALGDALVTGGWLPDDDWLRYEFGRLDYTYEKGRSWTALTLFPELHTEFEPQGVLLAA